MLSLTSIEKSAMDAHSASVYCNRLFILGEPNIMVVQGGNGGGSLWQGLAAFNFELIIAIMHSAATSERIALKERVPRHVHTCLTARLHRKQDSCCVK
jgi:hypothetical protein